jgi:hypothetical protein
MKAINIISILFLLTCGISFMTLAGEGGWSVVTTAGDTLRSCTIGEVEDGRVNLLRVDEVVPVNIDSIRTVFRTEGDHFWGGAGVGLLLGVSVGAIIGSATYEKPDPEPFMHFGQGGATIAGALAGGLAGFAVGGIIGAGSGGDEYYELEGQPLRGKIQVLNNLRQGIR